MQSYPKKAQGSEHEDTKNQGSTIKNKRNLWGWWLGWLWKTKAVKYPLWDLEGKVSWKRAHLVVVESESCSDPSGKQRHMGYVLEQTKVQFKPKQSLHYTKLSVRVGWIPCTEKIKYHIKANDKYLVGIIMVSKKLYIVK